MGNGFFDALGGLFSEGNPFQEAFESAVQANAVNIQDLPEEEQAEALKGIEKLTMEVIKNKLDQGELTASDTFKKAVTGPGIQFQFAPSCQEGVSFVFNTNEPSILYWDLDLSDDQNIKDGIALFEKAATQVDMDSGRMELIGKGASVCDEDISDPLPSSIKTPGM